MKGELALKHWQWILNNKTTAATSDLIGTEIDVQNAGNGTLVVVVSDLSDANQDIENLSVWTSNSDHSGAMLVSQIAKTATTNTVQVVLTSDTDNFVAWNGTTALTSKTITSSKVLKLDATGIYVLNCPDLRRYVNVQFTGEGTKALITAAFIADDLSDAPKRAARTAYTDADQ